MRDREDRARTLRRALGELVLIVVGVLLALTAADWQQRHADRQSEHLVLREMSAALAADADTLQAQVERYRHIETRVETLLALLHVRAPYADSLDAYFGTLYGFWRPPLNTAAYESLKSQGLGLVSDDQLRSRIVSVYELSYPRAAAALDIERNVILDLLRPYFLVHFKDLEFSASATPLDYSFVSRDPEFRNLADYRLQILKQNCLPSLQETVPKLRALRAAIDEDLAR